MSKINLSELNIKITGSSAGLSSELAKVTRDVKNFGRETNSIGASLLDMKGKLLGIGAAVGGLAALNKLKDFTFDGVKLAADLETTSIAFETMLKSGEAAKKLLGELKDFAKVTPFRQDDVVQAARQLLAFGTAADDIKPTLKSLGDLSSGTGVAIGELAELYGKARVQGTLYAEDINQLVGRGIPVIQEFAKQLGVSESQVKKLASEGKITFGNLQQAFADLTSEGGKFEGLMERLSGSTSGKFATLLDEIDELKLAFGEGILPTLTEFTDILSEIVRGGDQATSTVEAFRNAGEITGDAMRILAGSLQAVRGELAFFVQLAAEAGAASMGLTDMVFGTNLAEPYRIAAESLDKQTRDLIDSAKRFYDLDSPLNLSRGAVTPSAPQRGIESLLPPQAAATAETEAAAATADTIKQLGIIGADSAAEYSRFVADLKTAATPMQSQMAELRKLAAGVTDILGAPPSEQQKADYAYYKFRQSRNEALESGQTIDAEAPGLLAAFVDELKAQREQQPSESDSLVLKQLLDEFKSQSESETSQSTPQSNKPNVEDNAKLIQEMQRQAAIDRGLLTRIAAAVERKPETLKITEYKA